MKDVITIAEKSREIPRPLVKIINKAVIMQVAKVASAINIDNKYRWVISINDIDVAGDLALTGVKKY